MSHKNWWYNDDNVKPRISYFYHTMARLTSQSKYQAFYENFLLDIKWAQLLVFWTSCKTSNISCVTTCTTSTHFLSDTISAFKVSLGLVIVYVNIWVTSVLWTALNKSTKQNNKVFKIQGSSPNFRSSSQNHRLSVF